ncbi:MAG: asparagine synthetase B family protein, partial [Allosphingosinicella sp.]
MTALAGFFAYDGAGDIARRCERMLQAQQVHAPPPDRIWHDDHIALGRRLYKLLPEDEFDQGPVLSADGRRVLVADVRIDNREDLCRDLGLTQVEAERLADSAILAKALERWDEKALDRLVGDFAFAWWNAESRRLLLARDFLGQRPLQFHRGRGFFAFASMPKGLHALEEIPIVPNRLAAADFLALMPETGTETFFEGVEKVEPGHVVTVTREGIASRKYWQPDCTELRLGGGDDYVEALREQLDQAVDSRLRGAGDRVAATLSGGLDSPAVAATAARLLATRGGTVTAFTGAPRAGYSGRGVGNSFVDESPLAAKVAALYPNMEHVIVRGGAESPLDGLDRYFFLYERPFLNICNGVWTLAIQRELKARGLTVLLNGGAGNLTLSYDGMPLLTRLIARGRLLHFAREAILLRRNGMRVGTIAAQSIGPFLPASLWRGISRLRGKGRHLTDYSAISATAATEMGLLERAAERGLDVSYRPRSDPVETRLWVLGRLDQGNYNKGALAAWGIDGRDPTADRRLVEFCLRVPMEQYLADGMPRSLARRALADRLPDEVRLER